MIEPFYFGRDNRLFGIYHPADGLAKGDAILIAPPLLNEAMRAHFALRQIALKLSADGCDVLRFDFAGTGNSLGTPADVRLAEWQEDIRVAAHELLEISGADSLSVVGVRFAACLASHASAQSRYTRFVMWDPVPSGQAWLDSLRRSQTAAVRRLPNAPLDRNREFMGHLLQENFTADLAGIRTSSVHADSILRILHEDSVSVPAAEDGAMETVSIPFECNWESLSSQQLYPHEVVDRVCQFLT